MALNAVQKRLNADLGNLPFKGEWEQYVLHPSTFKTPVSAQICVSYFSQLVISSLNSIISPIFVIETRPAPCEVGKKINYQWHAKRTFK